MKTFDGYEIIEDWWKKLETNRGERAFLRRCASLEEVYKGPYLWSLWKKLKGANVRVGEEQLALTMALLSHVKTVSSVSNTTLPQAFGKKKKGTDSPVVSVMRFQRLLGEETREDLFRPLLAMMRMIDTSSLTLYEIASAIWFWSPETSEASDRQRKRWAKDYYLEAL